MNTTGSSAPAGLDAFTDLEILDELQRRKDEALEAERAAAAEYVRKNPDTLRREIGLNELWTKAHDAGLSVAALSEIWFATYGKKSAK